MSVVASSSVEVRKDGKFLESIRVVPSRKPAIVDGKEVASCFLPTVEDIKKHFPPELGYKIVEG